jgi:hypothetical protein
MLSFLLGSQKQSPGLSKRFHRFGICLDPRFKVLCQFLFVTTHPFSGSLYGLSAYTKRLVIRHFMASSVR